MGVRKRRRPERKLLAIEDRRLDRAMHRSHILNIAYITAHRKYDALQKEIRGYEMVRDRARAAARAARDEYDKEVQRVATNQVAAYLARRRHIAKKKQKAKLTRAVRLRE